jgi:protein dithiol oxidoreductase (disulfide-forming)
MKRREFTTTLAGAGLGLGLAGVAGPAQAQGAPVEGTQYVRLNPPAPVSAPAGKIEVVEFFWYGCPHCNALEPALEDWVKRLPADVAFRRVPVAFSATHESHQRLFYGLEAIGQLDALHKRVFAAIHTQQQRLEKDADQVAFVTANGVDGAKFAESVKSFSVQTKMRQAKQLSAAYKIDGVPAIGVHGRYYTAGSLAGDNRRALAVADYLIQQVRKTG